MKYYYNRHILSFFLVFFVSLAGFSQTPSNTCIALDNSWTGFLTRVGLGGVFDFELGLNKGDGRPSSAVLRYGIEYGYQFKNSGFYISGALDWTIVYARNFEFHGKPADFFKPPISLWYTPMTNVQLGWAFNQRWLATIGLVYYWGLSNSLRYRASDLLFIETNTVVWMDRIFNTGGFYGGGFDNLQWTTGIGFLF